MNGLVLAGGNSTRMGIDKADLIYYRQPQYIHCYNLLKKYCDEVWISSREKIYSLPTLIDDKKYADIGPMAGLLTAFEYSETDWLVLAVDYPFIDTVDIEKLVHHSSIIASVYYNSDTNFYEPFIGLYRRCFKKLLIENYLNGVISIQKILQLNSIEKVIPNDVEHIRSIDTQGDYLRIKERLNSI